MLFLSLHPETYTHTKRPCSFTETSSTFESSNNPALSTVLYEELDVSYDAQATRVVLSGYRGYVHSLTHLVLTCFLPAPGYSAMSYYPDTSSCKWAEIPVVK